MQALDVDGRASLWRVLAGPSHGSASDVLACLVAYTPPAERLIIRYESDFAKLGTTAEAVHHAADPSFWAFKDFKMVHESFSLSEDDAERRVMGIEGVGSPEALKAIIESGAQTLKIGHLSFPMLVGKLANGEWKWIDEASCVMYAASLKPALLRSEVRARLGVELRVLRHEKFLEGCESDRPESTGDLIIFDMDKADVTKATGNQKVFCQDPRNYNVQPFSALSDDMQAAVNQMLRLELVS